jgi:hypothetical protein
MSKKVPKIINISVLHIPGSVNLVYGLGEDNDVYLFAVKKGGWVRVLDLEAEINTPSPDDIAKAQEIISRVNRQGRRAVAAKK